MRYGCLAVVQLRSEHLALALAELGGASVLARIVARARAAALVDEVCVLVPDAPEAGEALAWLESRGIETRRGPAEDALADCLALATERGARHLVRLQGDGPFVDPDHVDLELGALRAFDADLVAYGDDTPARLEGPLCGQSTCSVRALRFAQASDDPLDLREAGEPFLARHHAAFRTVELELDARFARPWPALRLRTPADLTAARTLWSAIDHEGDGLFPLGRALRWLGAHAPAA